MDISFFGCSCQSSIGGAINLSTYNQLLKGILEGCILSLIEREEIYGYELSVKLKEHGFSFVSEGSIYPLLQRMQRDGLIVGVLRDSPNGPKRKYYFMTAEGKQNLAEFKENWRRVQSAVEHVLQERKDDEDENFGNDPT